MIATCVRACVCVCTAPDLHTCVRLQCPHYARRVGLVEDEKVLEPLPNNKFGSAKGQRVVPPVSVLGNVPPRPRACAPHLGAMEVQHMHKRDRHGNGAQGCT